MTLVPFHMKIAALTVSGRITPTKPVPVTTKPTPGKAFFVRLLLVQLYRINYIQYQNVTVVVLR